MEINTWALISLIVLAAIITISFIKNINLGLCALMAAFIIGTITGVSGKTIIAGFNTQLFVMLLGVTFFFGLLQLNGTLPILIRKCVKSVGKKSFIFAPLVYVMSWLISAAGPGPIPTMSLMIPLSVSLAATAGFSPVLMTAAVMMGSSGGGCTPIASNGIVINQLMAEQGYTGFQMDLIMGVTVINTFLFIIVYILFRGYKQNLLTETENMQEQLNLGKEHYFSMALTMIMIAVVLLTGYNIGLCGFVAGILLMISFPKDQGEVFSAIPWSTLILVGGVNAYMEIVKGLGGIDLLSNFLSSIMTPHTAAPLIAIIAGILSWFSSTIGVVLPTLVPLIPSMVVNMGGNVSAATFLVAMSTSAICAGASPMSTGGGLSMAAFSTFFTKEEKASRKHFIKLFVTSATLILGVALIEFILSFIVS